METKNWSDLKADPKNPRRLSEHDGKSLQNSLDKFGDLSCIVFNVRTQQLVGGHQRLKIMERLSGDRKIVITQKFTEPDNVGTVALGYVSVGNKQFAYREVDFDEGTQRAANIAANRISGEFDLDLLAEVNYELSLLDNGDELLALTGQTEQEISNLLDSVGANGENPADDEAPEVDNENPPVSKLGEIYQLGKHRLMCGDSTDFGSVSDLMDGQTANLALTDPPYGIDVVKNSGELKRLGYSEVKNDNSTEVALEAINILKELTKDLIIFGGNYFANSLTETRCWLVWDKQDGKTVDYGDGELAWTSFDRPLRIYKHIWDGFRRDSEVGEMRVHPTQKPVKLLADILSDYSSRDDSVLDLFGGSGSTLIACDKMGRTCYMMELSPAYIDVIRKRYHKHVTGSEEGWQEATPVIK